jgi:hypothetical protein
LAAAPGVVQRHISFSCIGFALSGIMSAYCHDAAWSESALLFGCVYSVGQGQSKDQLLMIAPILFGFYIILVSFPQANSLLSLLKSQRTRLAGESISS